MKTNSVDFEDHVREILESDRKVKLNLGCGVHKIEGYINIDMSSKYKPDVIYDINKGLSFKDNSVDEIKASHILEHVNDLIFVMNECWRVLKTEGILDIDVPDGEYLEWSMRDPTHKRAIFEDTFLYFSDSQEVPKYDVIKCNFKILKSARIPRGNNIGDIKVILQK